jgi:ribosomal protein L29
MKRQKGLEKAKGKDKEVEAEKAELKKKWVDLRFAMVSNACKLQTGLHW